MKIKQISPLDNNFTNLLDGIAVMPKILYYYGELPERRPSVAIVGTRKNTPYGRDIAYKTAFELAKNGVIIVSDLAMGIDGIAHRGALAAKGTTVAVLGTPIDTIHPKCHLSLAREILDTGGAIISEYPAGMALNHKRSFLHRNRLISGLSDIVIVVEANERSGSLNTAMHALEQGRTVFAVPGDLTRPLSRGCNRLIAQGANVLTSVDDVLGLLFPGTKNQKSPPRNLLGDSPEETALLRALASGEREGSKLLALANLDASTFNRTITLLEIKGRVSSLGLNRWCLT